MSLTKAPNAEPFPGYRLVEPLGKGGFGEVWKCEAPGGLFKAIKFVEGDGLGLEQCPADDELKAIQRIKALRHPFLLSIERVEVIDGELVLVTELADKSLQDLLTERRAKGAPGIPRLELLRYLREAADVLDVLNLRFGLQHLDIKPANLFLVSEHVKVADFGLVHSLADLTAPGSTSATLNAITPRYASPELFRGAITPTSDQYSLAVVYQELLTCTLPFNGKNGRQLALQHTNEAPNLAPLPLTDREVIERALSKNAADRFPNCTALVSALVAAGPKMSGKMSSALLRAARGAGDIRPVPSLAKRLGSSPAGGKFLPDYEFLKQLGRSPTAEAWAAQTKDGKKKLVRFLYGLTGRDKRRDAETLARLQALQHPGLPALEALPGGPGCVIVVTDQIDVSLRDRFQEAKLNGEKGLPRRKLLDWLWTAAETLDELATEHQVQHQSLTPRNLLLDEGRLLVGDFGLRALLQQADASQGRYVAPELLAGRSSSRCDQFSLAVIYQELLTGVHPLSGGRLKPPNLDALFGEERNAVARALHTDPEKRFGSCTGLLCALEEAAPGLRSARADTAIDIVATLFDRREAADSGQQVLEQLIAQAAKELPPQEPPAWLKEPDGGLVLEGRFHASLPPQGAEAKFEGFRRQWNAQLMQSSEQALTYHLGVPTRFWQRWFGQPPMLVVEIRWTRPRPPTRLFPEAIVRIRTNDTGRNDGSLLKEIGPVLLDGIQKHLHGHSERRRQERLVWAHPVLAAFVLPDGTRSERIECQGKDISLSGMGLYLPRVLPGTRLDLSVTTKVNTPPVSLAGNFVRVQRCGDGWYEAGILFE